MNRFTSKKMRFFLVFLFLFFSPWLCFATVDHTRPMEWHAMDSGTTETLNDIWGSSSSNIFVVGNNGTILHYDGTSWTVMNSPVTEHILAIWGRSENQIYAVGYNGTQISYDGSNWSHMGAIPHPPGIVSDVSGTSTGTWCAVFGPIDGGNGAGEVMKLSNGTDGNWIDASNYDSFPSLDKKLNAVYADSTTGAIFAGGADASVDGTPYMYVLEESEPRYRRDGSDALDNMQAILGIWGTGDHVFFMGVDYTIGQNDPTWKIYRYNISNHPYYTITTLPVTNLEGNAYGAWGPSSDNVFFVGDYGQVVHLNSTEIIVDYVSDSSSDLHDVWGTSDSDVYAVGEDGTILHFDGEVSELTLIEPVDDSVQDATSIEFSWEPVSWADGYSFQLSETEDMDQLILNDSVGDITSFTVNGFQNYGRPFFWQVTAYTSSGYTNTSPVYRFDNGIATSPILIAPAQGSSVGGTSIEFSWHPFEDATQYYFQLATDSAFSSIIIQGTVTGTQITLNGFPNDGTTYYWRIVHWDGSSLGPYWSIKNVFYNQDS